MRGELRVLNPRSQMKKIYISRKKYSTVSNDVTLSSKACVLVAQMCPTLCDLHGQQRTRLLCQWNSSGEITKRVAVPSLGDPVHPGNEPKSSMVSQVWSSMVPSKSMS